MATDQERAKASESARLTRVELYTRWLSDDVDGIIHNIMPPLSDYGEQSTSILADVRQQVALTLSRIDRAIEADRAHHAQQEHA